MTAQASHNDIMGRLEALAARFEQAEAERATYREQTGNTLRAIADSLRINGEALNVLEQKFGEEPDSDGQGGRGLIGDLRRQGRDMRSLMDLRKFGMGAVMGISLFGALIILGVIHWVEGLVKGAAS